MPKCPYCKNELHIEDFFEISEKITKKGKVRREIKDFKGEWLTEVSARMWICPFCDSILGFSEKHIAYPKV